MTYNVEVFLNELHVKTFYGVRGQDADDARAKVEADVYLDFSVEEND